MTTIVYNHKDKEIAVDSRKTKGGFIANDNHNKVRRAGNGDIIILSGIEVDILRVVKAWPRAVKADSCCGFAIVGGEVKWLSTGGDGLMCVDECDHNETSGSGDAYAISAMDFGCSAKDAVKYAMTRDIYTGGKIKVIKVK